MPVGARGIPSYTWQQIKMLNLIDFEHLQTILLSVAYAKIKIFSSIACSYLTTTKL